MAAYPCAALPMPGVVFQSCFGTPWGAGLPEVTFVYNAPGWTPAAAAIGPFCWPGIDFGTASDFAAAFAGSAFAWGAWYRADPNLDKRSNAVGFWDSLWNDGTMFWLFSLGLGAGLGAEESLALGADPDLIWELDIASATTIQDW